MQVFDLGAWTPYLEQELRAPYFAALLQRVGAARAAGTVYTPEGRPVFAQTAPPPGRAAPRRPPPLPIKPGVRALPVGKGSDPVHYATARLPVR